MRFLKCLLILSIKTKTNRQTNSELYEVRSEIYRVKKNIDKHVIHGVKSEQIYVFRLL